MKSLPHISRQSGFYLAFSCLIFLLFFHPTLAFNARSLIDDECYLRWLSRLLFFSYDACPANYTFPGTALIWLPGAAIARLMAYISGTDLLAAITTSIGITSFLCWVGSLFLLSALTKTMATPFTRRQSILLPALFLLSIPVLHYATVRSTMTHSAELLLCLTTLVLLKNKRYALALCCGLFLSLTRINDCFILLVILGKYVDDGKTFKHLRIPLAVVAVASLPLLKIAFISHYGESTSGVIPVLKEVSWAQLVRVLAADRYALSFTATFWLATLVIGTLRVRHHTWLARAGLFWMWFLFFICMGWGGMGNSFGYRYLIGTYPLALVIWMEWRDQPILKKVMVGLLAFNAIWLTHLTWVYDHYASLSELVSQSTAGRADWLLLVKQSVHPLKRWFDYSPLALSMKFLAGTPPDAMGFRGPFLAQLNPFQLWINIYLTAFSVFLLALNLKAIIFIRKTVPRG